MILIFLLSSLEDDNKCVKVTFSENTETPLVSLTRAKHTVLHLCHLLLHKLDILTGLHISHCSGTAPFTLYCTFYIILHISHLLHISHCSALFTLLCTFHIVLHISHCSAHFTPACSLNTELHISHCTAHFIHNWVVRGSSQIMSARPPSSLCQPLSAFPQPPLPTLSAMLAFAQPPLPFLRQFCEHIYWPPHPV